MSRRMIGFGYFALAGAGVGVAVFNFMRLDSSQKNSMDREIEYLRRLRSSYEYNQREFRGTVCESYYADMTRFTQDEINAREQWKLQPLIKRVFGRHLYLSDSVMSIERRAGEQVRLRNDDPTRRAAVDVMERRTSARLSPLATVQD